MHDQDAIDTAINAAFRRGYREGYSAALGTISRCEKRGHSLTLSFRLANHHHRQIQEWAIRGAGPPPPGPYCIGYIPQTPEHTGR